MLAVIPGRALARTRNPERLCVGPPGFRVYALRARPGMTSWLVRILSTERSFAPRSLRVGPCASAAQNTDCLFYSAAQWHKVFLDDFPDNCGIHRVVFMPQHISDRTNVGPWLFRGNWIDDTLELPCRFGDSQQAALDRVLAFEIVGEAIEVVVFGVAPNSIDVFENVVKPAQRLVRRQRCDPFRPHGANVACVPARQ